jgi:hypothetical protein
VLAIVRREAVKKALMVFGLISGAMLSTSALAAIYAAKCQSCGGGATSASWLSAAVSLAQANSATTGDVLLLCKDFPSASVLHQYEVSHAPVVAGGDITHTDTDGFSDLTCEDLGIL